ncbi:hypothetical protein BS50DRAFT_227699 [Corynespora cassiicola Philippines]|uniref:Uncharacterized protein n=1 Tax=Corynespora cassiicola Philippines TaxID=1448308 RepID=A0A2T2N3P1_CORCC|nr:hypothetical protein BS50DRAFT_227699 [Corynespora cassiicola Philippines]
MGEAPARESSLSLQLHARQRRARRGWADGRWQMGSRRCGHDRNGLRSRKKKRTRPTGRAKRATGGLQQAERDFLDAIQLAPSPRVAGSHTGKHSTAQSMLAATRSRALQPLYRPSTAALLPAISNCSAPPAALTVSSLLFLLLLLLLVLPCRSFLPRRHVVPACPAPSPSLFAPSHTPAAIHPLLLPRLLLHSSTPPLLHSSTPPPPSPPSSPPSPYFPPLSYILQ